MKFKITLLVTAFLLTSNAFAATKNIHQWLAGVGGSGWRTQVHFSNMCPKDDVTVTLKFWKFDGSVLTNTTLSGGDVTDSNGELTIVLGSKQTREVNIASTSFGSFTTGSAVIKTEYADDASNKKCLTAGYSSFAFSGGGIINRSYQVNNGKRF